MPDLSQSFEQSLEQSLHLQLSPRLLSMLKTLQMPYQELVEDLERQSEENPMIEIERPEALVEYLRYLGADKKLKKQVDFDEYPGLENFKDVSHSLIENLMEQLRLEKLKENEFELGEFLISRIDPNGYFKEYELLRAEAAAKFKIPPVKVDKMLELIQTFEPDGVGARDLKECLLLQVREYSFDNFELEEVITQAITDHLEAIANKEYMKAAAAMDISEEGVAEIANFIKENLTPNPASAFGEEPRRVVPSFAIEGQEGKYRIVNLEERYGPKVRISAEYERMLKDKKTDAETVKFLTEKLARAKELLEDLSKRGETSRNIVDIILEVQKDFLEHGPAHMRPLLQKDLAARLGLHPSTISRAIAGKYVQTPKGILPLKFFCPREFSGSTSASIKAKLIGYIEAEDKTKPLSDDELVERLRSDGIDISRRTLTKYRSQLEIPASEDRIKR